MKSNKSDRRRFLKNAAVGLAGGAAGLAVGTEWSAKGQTVAPAAPHEALGVPADSIGLQNHVRNEPPRRGARYSIDHLTHYTPLQDYMGIITPAPLHFVQQHSSEFPDIDASQHRLTIHGMVDRPLSFSMDDLKRLPSVSRVHFVECHGNSSPAIHAPGAGNPNMGMPVQYLHGMASCSEWSGVPFSVLLNE